MFCKLFLKNKPYMYVTKMVYATHSPICPTVTKKAQTCPSSGSKDPPTTGSLKRAVATGKCRMGFVPEEWFLFFHSKTGVSGPYLFGLTVINYMVSKEIFVMEHEYYSGLSELVVIYLVMKKLAPGIAAWLDKGVDDVVAEWEKGRNNEMKQFEAIINTSKDAQWRADGQKLLMDAKKENVNMQIEAVYRERLMHVYRSVRGRMDYHVKRHQAESRVHQKWMIGWILKNVRKSITPEFEKEALDKAIADLANVANRVQ